MEAKYEYEVDGITYTVVESEGTKKCDASDGSYHYVFDKRTGEFSRWGKTEADDPQWLPAGPEILDLEISAGKCKASCPFCYKGNAANLPTENMTFETFKAILDKMPKTLTQIAYGICDLTGNPDFFKMMDYAKANGVVPNFTLTGIDLTPELADRIAATCGAVAISVHKTDKNVAYDAIKMLTDRGMNQCNIHIMVSEETYEFVVEVMKDRMTDQRLKKMNAIVLLGVKPKGRAKGRYTPLSFEKFGAIVKAFLTFGIPVGFDSCSAIKFEKLIDSSDFPDRLRESLKQVSESCESSLFSSYINQRGEFVPCSFCEDEGEWKEGISVLDKPFSEVWHHVRVDAWRKRLIESSCNGCRKCLAFPEINV